MRSSLSTWNLAAIVAAAVALPAVAGPGAYLAIPDSTSDTVGMYSTFDGAYIGDIIDGSGLFSTPINAVLGPDGLIYVSDQLADSVFRYDQSGAFVDTFADGTDGLNNIRGIDFKDGILYVTSGDDYIARFDASGTRIDDFFSSGADPFDIYFLEDGRALVADIGTDDGIDIYNADGSYDSTIFNVSFPEQVSGATGGFLNIGFTTDLITHFDLNGVISQVPGVGGGRGIYELGNGNYLATDGSGVYEIDPSNGAVLNTVRDGVSGRFIELIVPEPSSVLLLGIGGVMAMARRRR